MDSGTLAMSEDFLLAHDRAVRLIGEEAWHRLTARGRVEAIYQQLRQIDAERAARQAPKQPDICPDDCEADPVG